MGGVCAPATVDKAYPALPSNQKDSRDNTDAFAHTGALKRDSERRGTRDSERRGSRRSGEGSRRTGESHSKSKKKRGSRRRRRSRRGDSFSRTDRSVLPFEREIELDEEFTKQKKLGRGSFGVVWRVRRNCGGKTYACKIISKEHCSSRELDLIYLECEMMHKCRHKHICRLVEVFDGREAVSMVMEEMQGGELFDRMVEVSQYTERDCAKQIRCVFQAIAHMHSFGVVHRDLKPENLCYQDINYTKLKVIDLGLSCYVDECPPEACGTFEFLAPEQMLEKGYDEKIDVFALGIIVYVMMVGKSPFKVPIDEVRAWEELDIWYRKMGKKKIRFSGTDVSKVAQKFIKGCLEIDPNERFSAEEAVNHEWLTGSGDVGHRSRRYTLDASQLKKYQVMHRLKRGVRTLICLKRMAKLLLEENERYQRTRGPEFGGSLQGSAPDRWVRADSWSVSIAHLPLSQRIKAVADRRDSKCSARSALKEYQYTRHDHHIHHKATPNSERNSLSAPPPANSGGFSPLDLPHSEAYYIPRNSRSSFQPSPNSHRREERIVHV